MDLRWKVKGLTWEGTAACGHYGMNTMPFSPALNSLPTRKMTGGIFKYGVHVINLQGPPFIGVGVGRGFHTRFCNKRIDGNSSEAFPTIKKRKVEGRKESPNISLHLLFVLIPLASARASPPSSFLPYLNKQIFRQEESSSQKIKRRVKHKEQCWFSDQLNRKKVMPMLMVVRWLLGLCERLCAYSV